MAPNRYSNEPLTVRTIKGRSEDLRQDMTVERRMIVGIDDMQTLTARSALTD
jgi:hypothetical protein